MTLPTTSPRDGVKEVVVYSQRLGLLGFGGPVALVGQTNRKLFPLWSVLFGKHATISPSMLDCVMPWSTAGL